ncbi:MULTISPECIES: ribonuclease J [unclassified Paenibacillus]|uniref:ribonuclease J n=1 Tax=unclassified Paenibacillus TaxID=185978 RepID=UPI000954F8F0|nr:MULTISPECIES: ribonuclease J [unclassified Paenibacillus]ASS69147.1 ribonuclease J [Paenibacillus sp. RUD330]SIQ24854.1 ribonuclease J [Paenibacillus sp. RU4X]SIQ46649.1 ribonuclease J [Paenibacillus sp. RU4T]
MDGVKNERRGYAPEAEGAGGQPRPSRLLAAALGGVNEIGKNMYMLQCGEDIVLIDCGSKFPDESQPGVDLIVPELSYLIERRDQVRALLVTHGHEDHIGGIPYLLKQLPVPVYATRLTMGLIEIKLKEHGLMGDAQLHIIDADSAVELGGCFKAAFFTISHSIPDCLGIVFDTPQGTIVHTGDFKFDMSPVSGPYPDLHRMADIGSKGVQLLLSESTNAERPGFTPSERVVGGHILDAFSKAKQRVFLSTFASNVNRVQQVVDASAATGRKLVLLGRSMVNVVDVAASLGYLNVPEELIIDAGEAGDHPPERIAVLCTGSQGEPMAALARLAAGSHRQMSIAPGDTVILAAGAIPGNERSVSRIIDHLYQIGANVIYGAGSATGMHVSGHGSQEELKLMLTLMKPRYLIPVHGEFRMLHQHRLLAAAVGIPQERVFILNNGDTVELAGGEARKGKSIPAGSSLVDGLGRDVGQIVLRDRRQLSGDGMLVVVVTLSEYDGRMLAKPEIISRGFVYVRDNEELMAGIQELVLKTVNGLEEERPGRWNLVKRSLKDDLARHIYARTRRRPMILPIVIEV